MTDQSQQQIDNAYIIVTVAPSEAEATECKDDTIHCESWAREGECKNNPGYMLVFCQKSCNTCSPTDFGKSNLSEASYSLATHEPLISSSV